MSRTTPRVACPTALLFKQVLYMHISGFGPSEDGSPGRGYPPSGLWTPKKSRQWAAVSCSCGARGSNPGPPDIVILQWPLHHQHTAWCTLAFQKLTNEPILSANHVDFTSCFFCCSWVNGPKRSRVRSPVRSPTPTIKSCSSWGSYLVLASHPRMGFLPQPHLKRVSCLLALRLGTKVQFVKGAICTDK